MNDIDPEQEKALQMLLAVIRRREREPWWNELAEQDARRRTARERIHASRRPPHCGRISAPVLLPPGR